MSSASGLQCTVCSAQPFHEISKSYRCSYQCLYQIAASKQYLTNKRIIFRYLEVSIFFSVDPGIFSKFKKFIRAVQEKHMGCFLNK